MLECNPEVNNQPAQNRPTSSGESLSLGDSYAQRACRLLEAMEQANGPQESDALTTQAVATAYTILRDDAQLECRSTFSVGRVRTEALAAHLKGIHALAFAPGTDDFTNLLETRYELVGRALETIAWYDLRLQPGDRVLQALQRAEILLPGDRRVVCRYAELAQEATNRWPSPTLRPYEREQILLAHKNNCRLTIEACLKDEFGLTPNHFKTPNGVMKLLRERFEDGCRELGEAIAGHREAEERAIIFELVHAYANLSTQIASSPVRDFFSRKGQFSQSEALKRRASFLSLAHGYSRALLQLINLSPEIEDARDDIREILDLNPDDHDPFGLYSRDVLSVLNLLSRIMSDKCRLDIDHEFRTYHRHRSEDLRALADEISTRLEQGGDRSDVRSSQS